MMMMRPNKKRQLVLLLRPASNQNVPIGALTARYTISHFGHPNGHHFNVIGSLLAIIIVRVGRDKGHGFGLGGDNGGGARGNKGWGWWVCGSYDVEKKKQMKHKIFDERNPSADEIPK
jgi:hypothetical protein